MPRSYEAEQELPYCRRFELCGDETVTKPNLFIVGAMKCGTTAWVEYLSTHPDIFFSKLKEPHHFTTDSNWDGQVTNRNDYLKLFDSSGSAKIVGEASATYLFSKTAARNIHAFNPNAKIIIFLRNQEEYLPSRHNQLLNVGAESITDFEAAWRLSGQRNSSNMNAQSHNPRSLDYRAAGMFHSQVERFYTLFPTAQVRVFHFNDWTRNPRETYLAILTFLGLADDGRGEFPPVNQARRQRVKFLGNLVHHPPAWLRKTVLIIKTLTGQSRLGLADKILQLNSRSGGLSCASETLKNEIRNFYSAGNASLESRIWVPSSSDSDAES